MTTESAVLVACRAALGAGMAALVAAVHRASAGLHAPADPWTRRFLLTLDAARFGVTDVSAVLAGAPPDPSGVPAPVVRWATGAQVTPRLLATLTGHERGLSAVVTTTDAAGRAVAVTGGYRDRTVRVWDLAAGTQTALLRPSADDAWALAAARLDGRPVVVTGSYDAVIQVWDVTGGPPIGRVDAGGGDLVHALAVATLDGRPVVVSTSATNDGDPDTYCSWPELEISDLATGRLLRTIDSDHSGAVYVATAVLGGRPVVVSGGSTDPALRVWDLLGGESFGMTFAGHTGGTSAITTSVVDGRPVLVAAGHDGTVRRWDLATGAPIGAPLSGVAAHHLAVLDLDGRPAVVAAGADAVCAWDLATGAAVVAPFVALGVGALAVCTVEGAPVAVTAMRDGAVRVWDLTPDPPGAASRGGADSPGAALRDGADSPGGASRDGADSPGAASRGGGDSPGGALWGGGDSPGGGGGRGAAGKHHGGVVVAVAAARVDGRPVVVSAGEDRTVHQWALSAPTADDAHLAVVPVDVGDIAVAGSGGRTRFVGVGGTDVWCWEAGAAPWRLATIDGRRLWSVATAVLDGRPVAVVGGGDGAWGGELRVVDLVTGDQVREVFGGHGSFVTSVATAVIDGRAVAVAAGLTETVARVWDLATGEQRPLRGHRGWIRGAATVGPAGRAHAVTGDVDGVLRQWNLRTCAQHGPALTGHTGAVTAVAAGLSGGQWPVAVTGGDDRTVRLWDLTTGEQIGRPWPFPEPVTAVAVTAAGVAVGFGFEVAVLETPVFRAPTP